MGVSAAASVRGWSTPPGSCSLARTFDALAPYLPPDLVSAEALARMRRVAEHLPAAITRWLYLECRLVRETDRVDIVIAISRHGRDILAGRHPTIDLSKHLRSEPIWQRIRTFCEQWADPAGPLHDVVHHAWLEFDVHSDGVNAPGRPPIPGIFVCFSEAPPPDYSAERWHTRAATSLRALLNPPMSPTVAQNVRTCFEKLPSRAYVPYVGLMFSRAMQAVRVCVSGLDDLAIAAYAKTIGWPGALEPLMAVRSVLARGRIDGINPRCGMVHIDVGEQVALCIGMEYGVARIGQTHGLVQDRRFLDYLVECGLCTPAKREGLLRWPGCSIAQLAHEPRRSLLIRRLNHFKIVYRQDCPLEAKGYLYQAQNPSPSARLQSLRWHCRPVICH